MIMTVSDTVVRRLELPPWNTTAIEVDCSIIHSICATP